MAFSEYLQMVEPKTIGGMSFPVGLTDALTTPTILKPQPFSLMNTVSCVRTLFSPQTWRALWRFLWAFGQLKGKERDVFDERVQIPDLFRALRKVMLFESEIYLPPEYVKVNDDPEDGRACNGAKRRQLIHQMKNMPWRMCLAVDIGGTRTKFKLADRDANEVIKIPSQSSQLIWETNYPVDALYDFLRSQVGEGLLGKIDRIVFSVPGTVDISSGNRHRRTSPDALHDVNSRKTYENAMPSSYTQMESFTKKDEKGHSKFSSEWLPIGDEEMTVVKNMPSFSSKFRGFDFKLFFKPRFPLRPKVSAVSDNHAAAIGCASRFPDVANGMVLVLGTAPAVGTFCRRGGDSLETGIWQSWVWFEKMELGDRFGYHGGIKVTKDGKTYKANPKDFCKMPHHQGRIRFSLDNATWQRIRGVHPTIAREYQGNLSIEEATQVWVARVKSALLTLVPKFHKQHGPADAIFILGGNSVQIGGKIDKIAYKNPEVFAEDVEDGGIVPLIHVPVRTFGSDHDQQDVTMTGLLQSTRFKVREVYAAGTDPLDRGWTRGGEIYQWIPQEEWKRTGGLTPTPKKKSS